MEPSGPTQPEAHELHASDGYVLRYRVWEAPEPARASIVLLNGIMSNSTWFGPLVPGLHAARLRVVGADRRGSGPNAQDWGDAPSAAQLVDDVLKIIAAQRGDQPVLLLGWCWGAALAIAVTAKLGEAVAGLVLVTPGMWNTAPLHAAIEAQKDLIERAGAHEAVIKSPIREEMFTEGPALQSFVRADAHRVMTMSPRLLQITGKLATGAAIRMRKLAAPMLVVLAEHDEATDNTATRAAFGKLTPGRCELVQVPGRHGIQFDAPLEALRHLEAFSDRVLSPDARPSC